MGRTKSAAVTLCMQINHRMYTNKFIWSAAFLVIALLLSQPGYSQIKDLMKKAENAAAKLQGQDPDLAAGLKEALNNGVGSAVESLSKDKGYFESPYKILIPEDARKVIDKVKLVHRQGQTGAGFSGCGDKTHQPDEQSRRAGCQQGDTHLYRCNQRHELPGCQSHPFRI